MNKIDLLIHGCTLLPMNGRDPIRDGVIAINAGKLVYAGTREAAPRFSGKQEIDARSKVALPGLINSHTHVAMTLFRGLGDDQPLDTWLKRTIWPLEKKLKPNDVYAGALLGCVEMIKSGTTCFDDVYFHERMVAKAVKESGLRATLAEGILDLGNRLVGELTLRRSIRFAQQYHGFADGRVTTMLGPHATYSCTPRLLRRIQNKAEKLNIGIHIHLAESEDMFAEQKSEHGLNEIELLNKLGLLSERLVAAHCVNLSSADARTIATCGVNVVHCPVANLKLGAGLAPIRRLVSLGANVALGTDGPASNNSLDMFETMKTAALIQKATHDEGSVLAACDILKMATLNGAAALGLTDVVGALEPGMDADLILVDTRRPHLMPQHNIQANLVYSTRGSDVDTTIANGRILMQDKQVKTINEQTVMQAAEKASQDLKTRS